MEKLSKQVIEANNICFLGRILIKKGTENCNPDKKREGLKTLTKGLILRDRLIKRSNNPTDNI